MSPDKYHDCGHRPRCSGSKKKRKPITASGLLKRTDELLNEAKVLLSEAHEYNDHDTVWYMRNVIDQLRNQKARLESRKADEDSKRKV
jgi:hypothetical protein